MSEREKARRALLKLEELEAKRAEQRQLERELRRRLEHQAYDRRRASQKNSSDRCAHCTRALQWGDEVEEVLNDDGSVRYRLCYPSCDAPWNHSRDEMERRGVK